MSSKEKKRMFTESEKRSYIREYLSNSDSRNSFEKHQGLSNGTLHRWIEGYQIEDPNLA